MLNKLCHLKCKRQTKCVDEMEHVWLHLRCCVFVVTWMQTKTDEPGFPPLAANATDVKMAGPSAVPESNSQPKPKSL